MLLRVMDDDDIESVHFFCIVYIGSGRQDGRYLPEGRSSTTNLRIRVCHSCLPTPSQMISNSFPSGSMLCWCYYSHYQHSISLIFDYLCSHHEFYPSSSHGKKKRKAPTSTRKSPLNHPCVRTILSGKPRLQTI